NRNPTYVAKNNKQVHENLMDAAVVSFLRPTFAISSVSRTEITIPATTRSNACTTVGTETGIANRNVVDMSSRIWSTFTICMSNERSVACRVLMKLRVNHRHNGKRASAPTLRISRILSFFLPNTIRAMTSGGNRVTPTQRVVIAAPAKSDSRKRLRERGWRRKDESARKHASHSAMNKPSDHAHPCNVRMGSDVRKNRSATAVAGRLPFVALRITSPKRIVFAAKRRI